MRRRQLGILVIAVLASAASEARAQRLPDHVVGLLGMRCAAVARAVAQEGHTLETLPHAVIWESGADATRVQTMVVSDTALYLYCERGRVVGFAAGRAWGPDLFRGVHPGLDPFDSAESVVRSLGPPTSGSFSPHGGGSAATWVRGRLLIHYSDCPRC